MQEVEIGNNFDPKLLSLKNFQFELETNSLKARAGIYISNEVKYRRMLNLEGINSHIVIIDTEGIKNVKRIINVYRSFNPQNNVNAREKFIYQLGLIKNAMCTQCLVIGDFNLDYSRVHDDNYGSKMLFNDFNSALSEFNLIQVVNFNTWSRLVGTEFRASILDHIYLKDPTIITDIKFLNPYFGDHVLIEFKVNAFKNKIVPVKRRDWRKYSKEILITKLRNVNWNIQIEDAQQYWNVFENMLVNIVDEIVPMVEYHNNVIKEKTPGIIKNKINKRNRLLKKFRKFKTPELKRRIADLNFEIRTHFFAKRNSTFAGAFCQIIASHFGMQ